MTFTKKIKHLLSNSWLILALVQLHLFATPKSTANFSKLTPLCPLTIGTAFTPVSCDGGTNGTASVSISGGSGNYSYVWSVAGQTGVTATNLPAATYTITVTDNTGGCTATASVTVTQPLPVGLTTIQKNISCMGLSNGTATANPTGGNGSFTYSWSNGQSAKTSSGLVAGSYTVKVTDQKGCSQTISVTLTQPTALTISATKTNVLCFGGNTGTATATAGGGIIPYTYAWSTSPVQSSVAATGLSNGGYTLTVTDANGCTITTSVNITQPTALTASTTKTNVLCFGGNTGTATVTGGGGITGYTYAWNSTPAQNTASAAGLSNGGYTVTVTDANGCTISTAVNITQPPLLTTTTSFINLTCYNYGNGSITATPAGGTGSYTF
ncbi:MAG: SprB repeat-containing protein, partial [Bacteroidia bacterium]|nr:SprB repeat-containing protein [Bacteroidia bacterium]